jgi:hypothetical protein
MQIHQYVTIENIISEYNHLSTRSLRRMGGWSYISTIFDFTSLSLYSSGTHWGEPTAVLDVMEMRKVSSLVKNRTPTLLSYSLTVILSELSWITSICWLRRYCVRKKQDHDKINLCFLRRDKKEQFCYVNFNLWNITTMALGLTQPVTEGCTWNLPGDKGRTVHKADNLSAICEWII